MTSTYVSYRLYTANYSRTLDRVASLPQISREAEYYKNNIGNVRSVDELLEDRRLFAYALRANGLEEMTDATAFMRKVLESDLNDTSSLARTLNDVRYVNLVRSFNFNTEGEVGSNQSIAQSSSQESDTVALYSEHRIRRGQAAAAEVAAYRADIANVTNVDDFISNENLFKVALDAHGILSKYASEAAIREVLTSDLSDVNSKANQLGGAYIELAESFQFQTDGSLATGVAAQASDKLNQTLLDYYELSGNGDTPQAAAFRGEIYQTEIASITTVDELLDNEFLAHVSLTSAGFDPDIMDFNYIRDVLVSDLSDPDSVANESGDVRFVNLAEAFNFDASGNASPTDGAQTADQVTSTIELYIERFDDEVEAAEARETDFFKDTVTKELDSGQIASVESVDELLSNTRLVEYIRAAYDLDAEDVRLSTIEQVLRSDPADPRSFANSQGDERFERLAAAFNFAQDGSVSTPIAAQTIRDEVATIRLYNSRFASDISEAESDNVRAENEFYHEVIATVETVDDLVDDARLKAYVIKAFGLENEDVSDSTLRLVLTSDLSEEKNFAANLEDDRYLELARAYNFGDDGKAVRIPEASAQTRNEVARTNELYLLTQLEDEAGEQSEGARLALYFRRRAEEINNPFDILADVSLLEVVRTGLGLPDAFSQASLDTQVKTLEQRLDLADFKDPEKVEQFLIRFGSFYDQANQDLSASPASLLFGDTSDFGISMNLLSSLQLLSIR